MNLAILSPTSKKNYSVVWLDVTTPLGNFVIQDGHQPMIVLLKKNMPLTFCLVNGKQDQVMIAEGILEITRESATVLLV